MLRFFKQAALSAAVQPVFSVVGRLPSRPAADETHSPLFGRFVGTSRPFDSPETCVAALRRMAFAFRPATCSVAGDPGVSPFSRATIYAEPRAGHPDSERDEYVIYPLPASHSHVGG